MGTTDPGNLRVVGHSVRRVDAYAKSTGQTRFLTLLASQSGEKAPSITPTTPPPARDYLEQVIHIIMESTGYERDEIEPDMDLRQDLAIRSSRLPVIMDRAERTFGIAIRLED